MSIFYGRVYLITNTVDGKVYVGATTKRLRYRWKAHCAGRYNGVSGLHVAMLKHGIQAFTVKPLAFALSPDELDRLERRFISEYKSTDPQHGYNVNSGGRRRFKQRADSVQSRTKKAIETRKKKAEEWANFDHEEMEVWKVINLHALHNHLVRDQFVKELLMFALEARGYWPPKAKEGK